MGEQMDVPQGTLDLLILKTSNQRDRSTAAAPDAL
jgi:hypothetical protein